MSQATEKTAHWTLKAARFNALGDYSMWPLFIKDSWTHVCSSVHRREAQLLIRSGSDSYSLLFHTGRACNPADWIVWTWQFIIRALLLLEDALTTGLHALQSTHGSGGSTSVAKLTHHHRLFAAPIAPASRSYTAEWRRSKGGRVLFDGDYKKTVQCIISCFGDGYKLMNAPCVRWHDVQWNSTEVIGADGWGCCWRRRDSPLCC